MTQPKPTPASVDIPGELPLLPVRDLVVFPFMIVPLFVSREASVAAVNAALETGGVLIACAQKTPTNEPGEGDLYRVGTVCTVMRSRKLADGRVKLLVQGLVKAGIDAWVSTAPYHRVRITHTEEPPLPPERARARADLVHAVKENVERLVSKGKLLSADVLMVIDGVDDPGRLGDLVAANLAVDVAVAQSLLEIDDPVARLERLNVLLMEETARLNVQARIENQAKEELAKAQREYFLREQMKQIQAELGGELGAGGELAELRQKLRDARMPDEAWREAEKQLRRLEGMSTDSAEAASIRTYLDWLADLPWSVTSEDRIDIAAARAVLDADHYDLEKIKERLLDYLSVRKLKPDKKGPILCFMGPPGVGKTSLGKSIARALGRSFIRISLGGVRDEAEVRGHRRTYVGAMPGRIVQGLKQAGSRNPVLMLDEIDKLAHDARGDPASALLEVLDPEQNHAFRDHYLNLAFDLSQVMFIATANLMDSVPRPLADRMEVLQLSGYSEDEKLHIARRYIVPKQIDENGLEPAQVHLSDKALIAIVRGYTREAGLRNLEREIATVCRKVARAAAEAQGDARSVRRRINPQNLARYLGEPRYEPETEHEASAVGVATGLAWTSFGGEVLQVETTSWRGQTGLRLTGQLGDVMKESAQAALSLARSRAPQLGIDPTWFDGREVHLHVPSGAIPKDGPSAGATMTVALVSLASGRRVRSDVAMTGEITLRGRLLPVGGVKEKVLAALRAGVSAVVLPDRNQTDVAEIPRHILRRVRLVFARSIDDVLAVALEPAHAEAARPAATVAGLAGRRRRKVGP